jgi:hypothetical protein
MVGNCRFRSLRRSDIRRRTRRHYFDHVTGTGAAFAVLARGLKIVLDSGGRLKETAPPPGRCSAALNVRPAALPQTWGANGSLSGGTDDDERSDRYERNSFRAVA